MRSEVSVPQLPGTAQPPGGSGYIEILRLDSV